MTHYEWAGRTLQALLGSPQRVAETWAFFSGPQKPARIAGAADGQVTMEDLVTQAPEVLGPAGADPDNHRQKYFFVKFLDPSDFPPFAYVGFNPDGLRDLGVRPDTLRHCVSTLLWEDRLTLESLAELLRPSLTSRAACERFTASYKRWAIEEAVADWAGRSNREWIGDFTTPALAARAQELLARLAHHRRRMVGLMHRIPFRPDQAILIESPTLHAIAGLSLQLHPNVPGNFHPKDELWIYKEIRCPDGSTGWILVEPQRTFDKTDSGADFFTPFVWDDREGLRFRKAISPSGLEQFVRLMDATPRPASHYLRQAQPMPASKGSARGRARWYRVVEEPGWPHFLVHELRFDGPGEWAGPLTHESFTELHVTQGRVELTLAGRSGSHASCEVSPTQPVFLPASLPFDTITYRAAEPAQLLLVTRRTTPR